MWTLAQQLPPDSAIGRALREGKPHWTVEAYLLDDLRMALTGSKDKPAKPHPDRPKAGPKAMSPKRRAAVLAARDRRRARRQRLSQR